MTEPKKVNKDWVKVAFVFVAFMFVVSLNGLNGWADEASSQEVTEKKETLTAEELLKSKAGQLFITRQYQEAVKEFQVLADQYPKDLAIKRYIGACLFQLKRDQEAIDAFKKILEIDSNDFSSHQFLAKIYLKDGDFSNAEKEFKLIVENDKSGTFVPFASEQLEAIKKMKESIKSAAGEPGRQISPDEFLKTKAASQFINAKYADALVELQGLEKEYPQDVLIKRYKGLALDKLGRYSQALDAYKAGLAIVPDNVAVHYFMAQTYFHLKDYEKAKTELEFVVNNDAGSAYKTKAQADLKAILQMMTYLKQLKPKRWSASVSIGQEYNTNATAESRLFKSIAEEHSFKMPDSFSFNYDLAKSGPWSTRFYYSHSDSFYWSVEHLNILADTFSVSTTYVGKVADRYLITQIAPAFTHATVDRKYYSSGYPTSVTFIYSFWDWHRIIVTNRFTVSSYKDEGTDKFNTSRDGFGYNLDVTNNIYFDKDKKSYLQFVNSWGLEETIGSQYVKDYYAVGVGIFAPLIGKVSGDIRFKFKDIDYPETNLAIQRHDQEWTISGALNIPVNDAWSLNPYYSYTNVNSKDNFYTYINHAGGANLTYNF